MGGGAPSLRVCAIADESASRWFGDALPLLARRGIDLHVLTLRPPGPLHEVLYASGVPCGHLGAPRALDYPAAMVRLRRWLRRHQPDLVHALQPLPGLLHLLSRDRASPPIILHRHHTAVQGRLIHRLSGWAHRTCDGTLAVSQAVVQAALAEGVPSSKLRVAWNGIAELRPVAAEELDQLRATLNIPPSALIVTAVARLRPEKGLDVLIRAFHHLNWPEVYLVIVGDGVQRDALRRLAATTAAAHRIRFVGHREDIAPWYALGDVVAIPSTQEPFALVGLEALAAVRPVVASAVEGLIEMFPPGSAVLVPPGDEMALATAIRRTLEEREVAERLAAAGRRRYEQEFAIELMLNRWIEAYQACLAGHWAASA